MVWCVMSRWRSLLGVLALAAVIAGCQRDRDVDGVGDYRLERTTLADAAGFCTAQDELTWCHNNPSLAIGEHSASVDLYFRGDGDDAPLVEILLAMRVCDPAEVEYVFVQQLGDPDERSESALRWSGDKAEIFLQIEGGYGSCEINLVAPSERARVAELEAVARGESAGDDDEARSEARDDEAEGNEAESGRDEAGGDEARDEAEAGDAESSGDDDRREGESS